MKTITFYVAGFLCLLATQMTAQEKEETFEVRANRIAKNIEKITKEQKDSLKIEVELVNTKLENNEITASEADSQKKEYAEMRAKKIETMVAAEEQKLTDLVKDKVDGKIKSKSGKRFSIQFDDFGDDDDTTTVREYDYKRTTSQFVFALGINRLMTDGEMDTENFKGRSDFYEWGISYNTRILKNNNLLHLKYGLSLQYNNLRPDNDKVFAIDGNKTGLVDSGLDTDMVRFRYVNLVVPVHLEFDFTPKKVNGDKTYYPTHEGFRFGIGGYTGFNVKEKQIVKYENEDGNKVKDKTRGDFNVNDFIYGVSAYIGYGEISFYAKYDLQPIFANNDVDQNNLSLGIRFDLN